ncbi:MAG: hypothetical protein K9M03_02615 [Kiritimatiellales bacterium]|nr:hypothetical protein [Kiritimatiellales bacterium]
MIRRYIYLNIIRATTLLSLLVNPIISKAATNITLIPDNVGACDFKNGDVNAECIKDYIGYLIGVLFALIGAFFFIMILVSGYQIAIGTVVGEKEKGKEKLKWAIVGFIISALAFFIVNLFVSAVLLGT